LRISEAISLNRHTRGDAGGRSPTRDVAPLYTDLNKDKGGGEEDEREARETASACAPPVNTTNGGVRDISENMALYVLR